MTISWNDLKHIDAYLQHTLPPEEAVLFQARLLTEPQLCRQVALQKKVHHLIRLFSRRQVKAEVAAVHKKMFSDPAQKDFQQSIFQLFNKP